MTGLHNVTKERKRDCSEFNYWRQGGQRQVHMSLCRIARCHQPPPGGPWVSGSWYLAPVPGCRRAVLQMLHLNQTRGA
jgi:hypothetical protein